MWEAYLSWIVFVSINLAVVNAGMIWIWHKSKSKGIAYAAVIGLVTIDSLVLMAILLH